MVVSALSHDTLDVGCVVCNYMRHDEAQKDTS